uniref:Nucleotide-diphospho-sugar transferase domain-containing protein n=1 Tax=viral metagenome TaxID=1070528 RepID=A0A6C0DRC0_9ZZZZ
MLEKSLVICYSTPNYSKVTEIFLNSLQELSIPINLYHKLDNPDENLIKKDGFLSELWYYCVFNKVNHLVNALSEFKNSDYRYFFMCDCDIQFIKNNLNEWNNLETYIESTDKDVYFMQEYIFNDANTGVYIIKNNKNIDSIIEFFNEVILTMTNTKKEDMNRGDQTIINNLKNKLNYTYIPNEYIVFGNMIFNKYKSLVHHSIGAETINDKINHLTYINYIFNINSPQNIFMDNKNIGGLFNMLDCRLYPDDIFANHEN